MRASRPLYSSKCCRFCSFAVSLPRRAAETWSRSSITRASKRCCNLFTSPAWSRHRSSMREMRARKAFISSSKASICRSFSMRSLFPTASRSSCTIWACTRPRHSPMARWRSRRLHSSPWRAAAVPCSSWLRCKACKTPCCSAMRLAPSAMAWRRLAISSSFSANSHSALAMRRLRPDTCEAMSFADHSRIAWRFPEVASTFAESAPTEPEACCKASSASRTWPRSRPTSTSLACTSARRTRSSTSRAETSFGRSPGSRFGRSCAAHIDGDAGLVGANCEASSASEAIGGGDRRVGPAAPESMPRSPVKLARE
mmetsp:Transcript_124032/g.396912  ORF Transcript_124032/g.396912 Transcript_124032/m.396912 type:complete len:313 (+) Transcript_124032:530-1468(+)